MYSQSVETKNNETFAIEIIIESQCFECKLSIYFEYIFLQLLLSSWIQLCAEDENRNEMRLQKLPSASSIVKCVSWRF